VPSFYVLSIDFENKWMRARALQLYAGLPSPAEKKKSDLVEGIFGRRSHGDAGRMAKLLVWGKA
jgi:hypothetical protein